jgi:hypothetical protein
MASIWAWTTLKIRQAITSSHHREAMRTPKGKGLWGHDVRLEGLAAFPPMGRTCTQQWGTHPISRMIWTTSLASVLRLWPLDSWGAAQLLDAPLRRY